MEDIPDVRWGAYVEMIGGYNNDLNDLDGLKIDYNSLKNQISVIGADSYIPNSASTVSNEIKELFIPDMVKKTKKSKKRGGNSSISIDPLPLKCPCDAVKKFKDISDEELYECPYIDSSTIKEIILDDKLENNLDEHSLIDNAIENTIEPKVANLVDEENDMSEDLVDNYEDLVDNSENPIETTPETSLIADAITNDEINNVLTEEPVVTGSEESSLIILVVNDNTLKLPSESHVDKSTDMSEISTIADSTELYIDKSAEKSTDVSTDKSDTLESAEKSTDKSDTLESAELHVDKSTEVSDTSKSTEVETKYGAIENKSTDEKSLTTEVLLYDQQSLINDAIDKDYNNLSTNNPLDNINDNINDII
jgi:hypothetical protein